MFTIKLIEPSDRLSVTFPNLGFRDAFSFTTSGEPVVVCDPIAIADVFNDTSGPAAFLRERGVFLADLGGDTGGPVLWCDPYLILRVATNSESELDSDCQVVVDEIRTDSGCFMFIPVGVDTPEDVRAGITRACEDGSAVLIDVPPGTWTVFYEQLAPPGGSPAEFYRNIVARRSAPA